MPLYEWSLSPNAPPPTRLSDWRAARTELGAALWRCLGDLPDWERPKPERLDVRTTERWVLERFRFDNGCGAEVYGYLALPAGVPGPVPALHYLHQHGGRYHEGKSSLLDAWPGSQPMIDELTGRGYAVLAIDAYGFGERQGQGPGGPDERRGAEELAQSKLQLWLGRSLWGMMLRDELMALDYLCGRPEIDPGRIGCFGMSMGSTRAWWLAALDDRYQAAVCTACLTRYQNLIAERALGAHGIYYFVPGLLKVCDMEAVIARIAPRALLTLTGDRDSGSPVVGVRHINEWVERVYGLYGEPERFRSIVYEGVGHEYTTEMWRETLDWFGRWLRG